VLTSFNLAGFDWKTRFSVVDVGGGLGLSTH
jgi:hypothetical protein